MAGLMGGGEQDNLLLEYLMEMGALQPEQQGLDRQRQMVEGLRGQSQIPQQPLNQGGRLRPAQSPLAMIAPLIGQGVAAYGERGVNAAEKALKLSAWTPLDACVRGWVVVVAWPRSHSARCREKTIASG